MICLRMRDHSQIEHLHRVHGSGDSKQPHFAGLASIGRDCFLGASEKRLFSRSRSHLERVTFEPGSKLAEIEPGPFSGCDCLTLLRIPGSLEKMAGASLPDSLGCEIEIGNANRYVGWPAIL
jgi:hypothetical protein